MTTSPLSRSPSLQRLELLVGAPVLEKLAATRVIVFGLGGVGSWCAEALIRSGIGTLAIVDSDVVSVTNINRQVQAMPSTVGKSKCAELAKRLRAIQPLATITEIPMVFDKTTAGEFDLGKYDYVIDAIDSLSAKVELIIRATQVGAKVYSALGASNKLDPTRIAVASLWDSYNCRLGKFVRKRLRRRGFNGKVTCIYSPEERRPFKIEGANTAEKDPSPATPSIDENDSNEPLDDEIYSSPKQINGSAVHITGTFGFLLAGLVIQDVAAKTLAPPD
jgi:tRNA A37 threonylcarbamoyladenosine dehydratase